MISVIKFVLDWTGLEYDHLEEQYSCGGEEGTYIKTIVGPAPKLHLAVLIIEGKPSDIWSYTAVQSVGCEMS